MRAQTKLRMPKAGCIKSSLIWSVQCTSGPEALSIAQRHAGRKQAVPVAGLRSRPPPPAAGCHSEGQQRLNLLQRLAARLRHDGCHVQPRGGREASEEQEGKGAKPAVQGEEECVGHRACGYRAGVQWRAQGVLQAVAAAHCTA